MQDEPGDLPARTGLAAVLRDRGELSQAKALYERILALAPHDSYALAGLAGVLHDQGDEAGAQRRFEQGGRPSLARRQPRSTR